MCSERGECEIKDKKGGEWEGNREKKGRDPGEKRELREGGTECLLYFLMD